MRRLSRAFRVQAKPHRPDRTAQIELSQGAGSSRAVDIKDGVNLRRRQPAGERAQRIRRLRRDAVQNVGETGKRRCVKVDGKSPARLRR